MSKLFIFLLLLTPSCGPYHNYETTNDYTEKLTWNEEQKTFVKTPHGKSTTTWTN